MPFLWIWLQISPEYKSHAALSCGCHVSYTHHNIPCYDVWTCARSTNNKLHGIRIEIDVDLTGIPCCNSPLRGHTVKIYVSIKISWSNYEVIVLLLIVTMTSKINLCCCPIWLDILQPMGSCLSTIGESALSKYSCRHKHLFHLKWLIDNIINNDITQIYWFIFHRQFHIRLNTVSF